MKLNLLLLFHLPFVFLFSFHSPEKDFLHQQQKAAAVKNDTAVKKWIDDFKVFRDAVYRNDTAKLKTFFKFPVLNPANEIWYVVLDEKELEEKMLTKKISPFTEKDFDKYSKKLFSKDFIRGLQKIKSEQLYRKGKAESPELKDTTTTIIKMYASVDKAKNILTLSLSYNTPWKEDADGTVLDGGESNIIYSFRILKNQHLQFMHIWIAG